MLSWISDTILSLMSWVPAWLYAEDSSRYVLVRGAFAIILIVIVVLLIALRPIRSLVAHLKHRRNAPSDGPRL